MLRQTACSGVQRQFILTRVELETDVLLGDESGNFPVGCSFSPVLPCRNFTLPYALSQRLGTLVVGRVAAVPGTLDPLAALNFLNAFEYPDRLVGTIATCHIGTQARHFRLLLLLTAIAGHRGGGGRGGGGGAEQGRGGGGGGDEPG